SRGRSRFTIWSQRLLCFGVVIAACWLHWRLFKNSGPLWRDEVSCVGLATVPTLAEFWEKLTVGSASPVLCPLVIRSWAGLFSQRDASLRTLGLLTGLVLIGALWFNARALGGRLPVLSLALVVCNAIVIRWGDTLRPYGLGTVLIVVAHALFWRL